MTTQWSENQILDSLTSTKEYQILDLLSKALVTIKNNSDKSLNDIFNERLTFKNLSYYEIIIPILSQIYPSNIHQNINRKIEDKLYGGKVWLNPRLKNKIVEKVLDFNFERLYPEVIKNLYLKGDIKFNNNRIGDVFVDLLNITIKDIEEYVNYRKEGIIFAFGYDVSASGIYDNIYERIISEIKTFKKILINYFYGMLNNTNTFYCDNFNMIPKYCINLMNIIIEEFKNDIIYVDTDEIYFRYSNDLNLEKFFKIIDITKLPYKFSMKYFGGKLWMDTLESNNLYNGIFFENRKFILYDKDKKIVKMRGFSTYKEKSEDKRLEMKINQKFKSEFFE